MTRQHWWSFIRSECIYCGLGPALHTKPAIRVGTTWSRPVGIRVSSKCYVTKQEGLRLRDIADPVARRAVFWLMMYDRRRTQFKALYHYRARWSEDEQIGLYYSYSHRGIHKHPGRTWRGWMRLPAQKARQLRLVA